MSVFGDIPPNEDGTDWSAAIDSALDRIRGEAAEAANREPLEVDIEYTDGSIDRLRIPGMGPLREEL